MKYALPTTLVAILLVAFLGTTELNAQGQPGGDGDPSLLFDFDGNGVIDCNDLDEMTRNAIFGEQGVPATPETDVYDITGDAWLTTRDIFEMIHIVADAMNQDEPIRTELECELGDLNFDNVVDECDNEEFNYWYSVYNECGNTFTFYTRGDINGDGLVNFLDFHYLFINWYDPDSDPIPPQGGECNSGGSACGND